jgi:hypothetical protein
MTHSKGAMWWAAIFVALSAALHTIALPLSGFSAEALRLLPFGLVYAGFAYGLMQAWRWLAYIVFIVLLIGISLAIGSVWSFGDVPSWIYITIAIANLASVMALFVALWRAPQPAQ